MKANALMIGDWVLYNPNVFIEDEYEPTKACYPTKISSGEDLDLAVEGCYAPIPLTPEILEKNGFIVCENTEIRHDYIWHDNNSYIYVIFWNDGNLLVKMETNLNEGRGINSVHNCDIVFVHELQHCLKMVGIDKEIKLNN